MISTSRYSIARPLIGCLLLAGSIAAGTVAWPGLSPAVAQERTFSHSGVARDAERYELTLKTQARAAKVDVKAARAAADKALAAKDQRTAAKLLAQIAGTEPANAAHWQALASTLLAIPADSLQGSERYEVPLNASAAAYLAAQRAAANDARASALVVLADGLKRRSMWRPALDAYRSSLALSDVAAVRVAYEKLKSEHGFRILDYKVENESQSPRLCVQLSERIATRQGEPSRFVAVDGKDPQSVAAEGQQICVEGLQHGKRYEVLVRAGLPSESGDTLTKASELAIYVKDRAPSVRFSGKSYVLPSRGQQGLPVVTINTKRIAVEVFRVGDRNLAHTVQSGDMQRQLYGDDVETLAEKTGQRVWKGEMDVATRLNEEVTTAIPVGDAIPKLEAGVYAVIASIADRKSSDEDQSDRAAQWFVVSDLGLTAFSGESGIHGFVRSLATSDPVAEAKVRLVARNNEVLGEARTDAAGYVRFSAGLKKGEGGLTPALLVAENANGGDYAFLDLATSAFDLSDRGVKGRAAPGPIDAYLYLDRGVFRPGETVNLSALVRDRAGAASGIPMTLIVTRPDGVEHRRIPLADQGYGGRTHALTLASTAMTGTWRAKLHADPKADPLAQVAFLVEDFVPERLELKLSSDAKALSTEAPSTIDVTGRYLYGPPADDLAVEGDIVVKLSSKELDGLAGFQFGLADEKVSPVRKALEGLPRTGKDGRAKVAVSLPAIPKTSRPLEADLLIRLREPGGRTIERTLTLPIAAGAARLGIRQLFQKGEVAEGEPARFEAVLIDPAGKRITAKPLAWTLLRLDTSWQWYSREGSWAYEAVTLTRKVASGEVTPGADGLARIESKVDWGRYRLEVAATDGTGAVASSVFNSGWYAEAAADSPEQLDVALDKASYKAGETARLRIASRHAGKALITVLGDAGFSHRVVDVPRGGAEVPVEVTKDLGAGAYVAAVLYRSMDEAAKRMPSRALGISWLSLDQAERTLAVSLGTPEKVRSGAKLVVPVEVKGLKSGEDARITLAAVDAGILNLTRFEAPKPEGWFYAQRKLSTDIRDLYGRLIDGMRAERGKLRSGGDGEEQASIKGPPPVETLLSLFSGIVTVGTDGKASVELQLPDFNGTVRLMAVAWSRDKVGHGTKDVIVRDPVALIAATPRFLTYGDEARIELDFHNVELGKADINVAVEQETASGTRSKIVERTVALDAGQRRQERFALKPTELGLVTLDVRATGPQGLDLKRRLTLDVKAPADDIKRTVTASLASGGGKLSLSKDLLTDLIPGRTRITMSVGPAASLDVPGLLNQLDRYPYGCAEQTTSRALPLLSYNTLAPQVGLAVDKELRERVQKAVDRVLEMQDSSGAFGLWSPRNPDMWLSSYVSDFITRAKESGYSVSPRAHALALDRLQNFISYAKDFETGGEARAYALYVLARNGRAPTGELRYYVDTRLDRFSTPLSKAQLGAALAMVGDKERSEKAFRAALTAMGEKDTNAWRPDYGTSLRDGAALVTLAAETRAIRDEAPKLASVLAAAFKGRQYTSTQEKAWMLLAAKAMTDQAATSRLSVGTTHHTGAINRQLSPAELGGDGLVVKNDGDSAVDAVVSVIGAALTPEPAISKGIKLERSYYTLDGKKVDLKSAAGGQGKLAQTDRLVAVIKVEAPQEGGRILVVDRLPAGLEIENPRLVDSGDLRSLDWLKPTLKPEHTEFRDDRFVASFNFRPAGARSSDEAASNDEEESEGDEQPASQPQGKDAKKKPVTGTVVAYIVRAVTPGSFVHPAATAEDMYRPERFARTAAGRLEVTGK